MFKIESHFYFRNTHNFLIENEMGKIYFRITTGMSHKVDCRAKS